MLNLHMLHNVDVYTVSPSEDFIRRDIAVTASWFYHFNEYPAMLQAYQNGLAVSALVTHRFELDQAAAAYQSMADGTSGK